MVKLPGVWEVAMQGGLHAADSIRRRFKDPHAEDVPLRYRDLGGAAAIGRFSGRLRLVAAALGNGAREAY